MSIIQLPTKQTLEGARFSQLKWLIYGPSGIGKTTFFSKMEDGPRKPLIVYTDPGQRFIRSYKLPVLAWRQFTNIVDTLVAKPPTMYSIVVIDTVDILFRMCRRFVCEREGINHVSELEWGKGTDMVRDEFELAIAKLAVLDQHGIGLGFISHSKDVEVRGRAIRTSKIVPTMQTGAYSMIAPLCDVIGYAGFTVTKADESNPDGIGRVIHFNPDETHDAKDRTGMLPEKCKLDFDVVRKYLEEGGMEESEEDGAEEVEEQSTPAEAAPRAKKKKKRA